MHYLIYTAYRRRILRGRAWKSRRGSRRRSVVRTLRRRTRRGSVVDTVADVFETGDSSKRPGWQKIMRELKSGKAQWDVLVMHHLDRFARSMADAVATLEVLHQQGKEVIATAQGLDTRTPHGRSAPPRSALPRPNGAPLHLRTRPPQDDPNRPPSGLWPVGTPPFGYKRGQTARQQALRGRSQRRNRPPDFHSLSLWRRQPRTRSHLQNPQKTKCCASSKNRVYLGPHLLRRPRIPGPARSAHHPRPLRRSSASFYPATATPNVPRRRPTPTCSPASSTANAANT